MTRDNAIWTVLLIAGVLGYLGGHYDVLQKAFPGLSQAWSARIELFSGLVGLIAGALRMSPLDLSEEGKLAARAGKL